MPVNKRPGFNSKYPGKGSGGVNKKVEKKQTDNSGLIRLNKFIANAGIASRREADKLIVSGVIKVNGKVVTDLGVKVSPDDKIQFEDRTIVSERKVYVLLNKPKGYITTTDDPMDRKTVMTLLKNAGRERIYPVGRLDRDTTGVLLLTNDGDLAKKLTHPRYRIQKIYHVVLDKNIKVGDLHKIAAGIELEDGFIKPDAIDYVLNADSKKEVGIEIHSGKNRVIRRLFESLEYKVTRLDRVSFAGLTKKDVPRGKWRFLNEKEIAFLKMK
jgi:23S rRNA pseudouridine2605 synthase